MKETREFRPHSVQLANGPHGTLVRGCTCCGATWELRLKPGDVGHVWMPVEEYDGKGNPIIGLDIDITYCHATGTVVPTVSNPVAVAPRADERRCYCSDCYKGGRKEHYQGDAKCYCVKCRGTKEHRIA